jgi:hypothetical protein
MKRAQAVVVAPSRELAMQIMRVGQGLLPHEARGCVQQAIGGANIHRQVPLRFFCTCQRMHRICFGCKCSKEILLIPDCID